MNSLILALLTSGFVCPPVPCALVFLDGEYIACCYEGHALEPVSLCGDGCIRVDLDPEDLAITL